MILLLLLHLLLLPLDRTAAGLSDDISEKGKTHENPLRLMEAVDMTHSRAKVQVIADTPATQAASAALPGV